MVTTPRTSSTSKSKTEVTPYQLLETETILLQSRLNTYQKQRQVAKKLTELEKSIEQLCELLIEAHSRNLISTSVFNRYKKQLLTIAVALGITLTALSGYNPKIKTTSSVFVNGQQKQEIVITNTHNISHALFEEKSSIGNIAVGVAEGNFRLTPNGTLLETPSIEKHDDPGNEEINRGYCSWNKAGDLTKEEADSKCLSALQKQSSEIERSLQSYGVDVKFDMESLVNGTDLYNQSKAGGRQYAEKYKEALNKGLTGAKAYLNARVEAFRVNGQLDAKGLFRICNREEYYKSKLQQLRNGSETWRWNCIALNQRTRIKAISKVLKSGNIQVIPKKRQNVFSNFFTPKAEASISNSNNQVIDAVLEAALSWKGRHFKEGESARCADWVRHVFSQAETNLKEKKGLSINLELPSTQNPVDKHLQWNNGGHPLRAQSFFGENVGVLIFDKSKLQPGDLIAWANTYGSFAPGAITHVGIYIGKNAEGEQMIIDRSTRSDVIKVRSINHFKRFVVGVRPHVYSKYN